MLSIAFRSCSTICTSSRTPIGIRAFASTVKAFKMRVVPVLVSADNYAYLLIDEPTRKAAVVDVLDVEKVQAVADKEGVSIVAGITTHHHQDHSGGNKACLFLTSLMYWPLTVYTRHWCVTCPICTIDGLPSFHARFPRILVSPFMEVLMCLLKHTSSRMVASSLSVIIYMSGGPIQLRLIPFIAKCRQQVLGNPMPYQGFYLLPCNGHIHQVSVRRCVHW